MAMWNLIRTVAAAAALLCTVLPVIEALPSGFVDEGAARVWEVTGFNFAPPLTGTGSQMMLVTAKTGILWVFPDVVADRQNKISSLNIEDKVCFNGERGLNTVAAHPNFAQNKWIYMYYTYPKFGNCGESLIDGPVNRLSRWKMKDDYTLDPNTEFVLFETSPLRDRNHNGGDILFREGNLYVTIGDGGERAEDTAQNRGDLKGSVLRLTDTGGIPPDNPYVGAGFISERCNIGGKIPPGSQPGTVCQEIYAYGFRNPFRFALEPTPNNPRIFVNDVGGSKWEETDDLIPGGNYGWAAREGPCELASTTRCAWPGPQYVEPTYWYEHTDQGGASVGITFVPPGVWPFEYEGTFLSCDFVFGEIYVVSEAPELANAVAVPPIPGWRNTTFHEYPRPVQLTFGPYENGQALYYTSRRGDENIRRIRYLGGENNAPIAGLTLSTNSGPVGTTINFDASSSLDPDGDALTYIWNFGDGTAERTTTTPTTSHTYNTAGTFQMTLAVRDSKGFQAKAQPEQIVIGTPPVAVITSPAEGTTFAVGEVFTISGSAEDKDGMPLPDNKLTWEVRQHHNTHFHPFLDPVSGNNIRLSPAPGPEDFEAVENSYLEVLLTATDNNGVETTITRNIQPKMVNLDFDSVPSGFEIFLDDYRVTTPASIVSWENHDLRVEAPDQNGLLFRFWNDGASRNRVINVPPKEEGVTPTYVVTFALEEDIVPTMSPSVGVNDPPTPAPAPVTTFFPTDPPVEVPTAPTNVPTTSGAEQVSSTVAVLLVCLVGTIGLYL